LVEVGREAVTGAVEDAPPRGARLEPDVEDVGLAAPRRPAAGAAQPGRREVPRLAREPGVGALLRHDVADVPDERGGARRLVAALAVQRRDRDAPRPLARDAPV